MIGTIVEIGGHPMSGLWQLLFDTGDIVHIESGHGIRQLVNCFGEKNIIGATISYDTDAFGILEGFTPIEEE